MTDTADAALPPLVYDDAEIAQLLKDVRHIAMVGASANPVRPSNEVMKYMLDKGYAVVPVNPGLAGDQIWEQMVYADMADIPGPIDMVDVFRASKDAGGQAVLSGVATSKRILPTLSAPALSRAIASISSDMSVASIAPRKGASFSAVVPVPQPTSKTSASGVKKARVRSRVRS